MNRVVKLTGIVVLLLVEAATAQEPRRREGFWAALGVGYGSNSLTCGAGCSVYSNFKGGSPTLALKMGGTPNPRLRLGGEVNVWVKDVGGGVTESVGNVSAAAYFYPSARGGFFVKGGVGMSSLGFDQGSASSTTDGVGFVTGLGYDMRLGGKWSLAPVSNFYFGHEGDFQHAIVDFGLSIQYN
jgi:hypothetical protein